MLPHERKRLSELASEKVVELFRVHPGEFYQESVTHKFMLLLQTVDRAVVVANGPVIYTGLIPGYDLIVLKKEAEPFLGVFEPLDPRAVSTADETCLALLARACEIHFASNQNEGESPLEGVFSFLGEDGLMYVGFKSEVKDQVLRAVGVSPDGLVPLIREDLQ